MKTRHIFILLLAFFAALSAKAQNNIAVASFRLLDTDLTANLQGTMRIDQNGHTCALIKVVTTQTGFTFDVGIMGITDTRQEPGEIWVWVPFGVKHMTIRHPQLGVLRDYRFPCSIEEARTYEMVLISGTVKPIIGEDMGGSYLVMTVEPKTALVYIDEQLKSIEDGVMQSFLTYGHHTYRVEAPSYMNEAGAFEIGKERVELNISLVSAKATLTVNCPDAEADIYINEQKKGRGSWTGQLAAETYIVEARKAGHRTEKQSLTLAKQEQKTVTLNAPQPIYGKLNLTSTPANCEVYLDGKMIGKSPDVFPNILIGEHSVELRKNGYETQRTKVNIEEGKIADISLNLQRTGSVAQQPEVQLPQPQQNETPAVQTDKWKTFIMARDNRTVCWEGKPLFGFTVGQVKKTGWYLSCLSAFNLYDEHDYYDDYKYKLLDLTAGAIFRCKNALYWYAGAGWGKRIHDNNTYQSDYGGVNIETGAMFHFKNISFMAGIYGITLTHQYDLGFQFGLGYNFGGLKPTDKFYTDSQSPNDLAQQTEIKRQQTDKKKTFIMANASRSVSGGEWGRDWTWMYGLTFGQVKKNGWYMKCMTNIYVREYKDDDKRFNLTGGGVFCCAKPFYIYAGAGYALRSENYYNYYNSTQHGVAYEGGAMLHFDGFSISVGISRALFYPWYTDLTIGLGYNF